MKINFLYNSIIFKILKIWVLGSYNTFFNRHLLPFSKSQLLYQQQLSTPKQQFLAFQHLRTYTSAWEMSLLPMTLIISLIWFLLLNITLLLLCKRSALLDNRCKELRILDLMFSEAYIFKISILFLWRSSFVQFIGAFL